MLLLLLLAACAPEPDADDTDTGPTNADVCPPVAFEDPGMVCLSEDGLQGSLVAIGDCMELLDQGCTAILDGDRVLVEGWASVDTGCPENGEACTLGLSLLVAGCDLPALTDGTWTLVYGAREVELEWPVTAPVCVGENAPEL